MTPLRFLLVGPGGMGTGHVAALQTIPDATIVGVCDIDPEVRQCFTDQGLPAFEKWDDLYDSVEADCALINRPHYLYPEAVIGALERGLHVLKEKPFARTLADAERMAAAAEEFTFADTDALAAEQREFIAAIRENRPPLGAPEHALEVQRVIEAAYRSAETGQRVGL